MGGGSADSIQRSTNRRPPTTMRPAGFGFPADFADLRRAANRRRNTAYGQRAAFSIQRLAFSRQQTADRRRTTDNSGKPIADRRAPCPMPHSPSASPQAPCPFRLSASKTCLAVAARWHCAIRRNKGHATSCLLLIGFRWSVGQWPVRSAGGLAHRALAAG